ncbi:class I SAM-dependent methyltransferase [Methanocella sp. CWC-04]|uniref:Class I SAM-dependent methyltransferase n=1 Tax=Methanooceanicella nereidis TaxID=2052831 RepID=A0AAP2W798_9EURY|nr:class I SAM-dependent methyltransferase [Methanocella sp. CWC-04]MCD1294866.1 class I SAM-dependent methyltransferase [Methanocella sp. CWC-04]
MSNKSVYERQKIVEIFSKYYYLDKPELSIICKFEDKLPKMKMLDLGVGAGRTTHYFGRLAEEYVGIDYSRGMIDRCNEDFKDLKNCSFQLCDVRDMRIFRDEEFDFILFSFNGLDCISHGDRINALREINRICKKGGYFFFSSHNLNYIEDLYKFKFSIDPFLTAREIAFHLILRARNKPFNDLKNSKFAVINDGTRSFSLNLYYIYPGEQIKQLHEAGFKNIRIYSQNDGREIEESKLAVVRDHWLHYLCEK